MPQTDRAATCVRPLARVARSALPDPVCLLARIQHIGVNEGKNL